MRTINKFLKKFYVRFCFEHDYVLHAVCGIFFSLGEDGKILRSEQKTISISCGKLF